MLMLSLKKEKDELGKKGFSPAKRFILDDEEEEELLKRGPPIKM